MLIAPTSSRMAKSTSLGVLEHEHHHMHIVDQDDIIGLTQDVKNFSDGLAKLKNVLIAQSSGYEEDLRVLAHERLGEVLCTLKSVLQRYPPLNTTELFSAAGTLISRIRNYNYEEHEHDSMDTGFSDAIDQLALEFSSSVSEYLMGDAQDSGIEEHVKTKSYDNLMSVSSDTTDKDETEEEKEETVVQLTAEEIDTTLMKLQAGLDLAFQRAKAWSKYLKDVMSYIERRAQLEVEYAKNLARLASTVKPSLTEEGFSDGFYSSQKSSATNTSKPISMRKRVKQLPLYRNSLGFLPLQSVYCTVLSQPLTTRRNDHDRTRKTLKESWNKEVKKMQEAVGNLRKAQSLYVTRQQEHDKAKELSQKTEQEMQSAGTASTNLTSKMEKRKKMEDESLHKAAEAETTYKACVAEANHRQNVLQKVKSELLAGIRDQLMLSDQLIKKVTIEYFQLLQTVSAPVPVQYHTLCEASKRYSPGSQYAEFVRRLPVSTSTTVHYEEFRFEPFNTKGDIDNRKVSTQSTESLSSELPSTEGSPNLSSPRRDKYRVPVKAWSQQGIVGNSDTDSQSGSSKSLDSSPSNSPYPSGHKKMQLGSEENLIDEDPAVSMGVKQLLSVPGADQLDVQSLVRRQGQRRNTTFGVDFQEQVDQFHSAVPPIISKCLKEVEKRGITVKGIYRVSGVKSTVENLCQKFENDPRSVSLDNENPNVISNVLKLYLRQLPEPLLTFKLYPGFIQMAKENMSGGLNKEATIERLHNLIDNLPFSNRKTCGVLMHHLQRVAAFADQNQMNASNLGIVFGPTLLRPQGGNASLACLVDTPHQTRVVELLIIYAETLFGPNEDHQIAPGETPIEHLEKIAAQAASETKDEGNAKSDSKKESSQSSNVPITVSKEELVPPNIPDASKEKDSAPSKRSGDTKIVSQKTGEEFYLPGSASFEKKETQLRPAVIPHSHSEGEDNRVENGYDNDNSADSDIHSDEDLPLPDDSHLSQNAQHESSLSFGYENVIDMTGQLRTPPTSRHHSKSLPSPASSPALSSRGPCSAPPSIRIDSSTLHHDADIFTSDTQIAQNKVYQLPPVNTWVPKGESLFNSILDARSPQVYRRTNTASSKTASYPQALSPPASARVSWPQSNTAQLSPPLTRYESQTVNSEPTPAKSPKLLHKCTSFDIERSKPFPARSAMTSPSLFRKSTSLDDSDKQEKSGGKFDDSPSFARKMGCSDNSAIDMDQIVLREVENEESDLHEIPKCSSDAHTVNQTTNSIDTVQGAPTNHTINGIERTEASSPTHIHTDRTGSNENIIEHFGYEDIGVQTSPGLNAGARPKKKTNGEEKQKHSMPKTAPSNGKQKSGAVKSTDKTEVSKSAGGPIIGQAGLKPVKKSSSLTDKTSSKSKTSSVKSAIITSAAKLKSISKRNPVTLLSYKSASITIPDHTTKASRKSSKKGKLVHQSESSPTVLLSTGSTDKVNQSSDKKPKATDKADKMEKNKPGKVSSTPAERPVFLSVQGLRRSSQGTAKHLGIVPSPTSVAGSTDKPKRKVARSPIDAGPKSVTSKTGKSDPERRTARTPTEAGARSVTTRTGRGDAERKVAARTPTEVGVKSVLSKTAKNDSEKKSNVKSAENVSKTLTPKISASKKTKDLREKWPEDKSKVRQGKRDSVGSLHSEPSRKLDHFRDCCHGKKK